MKKYDFLKFEKKNTRGDTKIAIHTSGVIRLSSGFCRVTNTTNAKYVIFFYDMTNKAIAFKFVPRQESGALKVTKDRAGAVIWAKSFMQENGLLKLRSIVGRYDWKKQTIPNIGEVFIIDLGKK